MTTLNDILLSVATYCLPMHRGISTATGTTQTLIDATRTATTDQFNKGILFFLSGTYVGQYKDITDYDGTTGTFTFSPVTAGNVPSGVLYAAFALMTGANAYDIIGAVNHALFELGDIPTFIDYDDDATLISVDQQEEYTLPTGVQHVTDMWIAANTASPYAWQPFTHYEEKEDGVLRIPYQYTGYLGDGYPLMLKYRASHDTLTAYNNAVNRYINKQWLLYSASINLIRALANRGNKWSDYKTQYEEAQQKVVTMRPIIGIHKKVKGA